MKLFGIRPGEEDATAPCSALLAQPDERSR